MQWSFNSRDRRFSSICVLRTLLLLIASTVGNAENVEKDALHPKIMFAEYRTGSVSTISYINGTGQQIYDEIVETNKVTRYAIRANTVQIYTSLGFDYEDSRIFYSDETNKVIFGETLDGSNQSQWVVYSGTSATVEGITVDWLANNTYWTDAVYKWVKVSNVDGSYRRSLITTDLDHPAGIACNPSTGYLYWSDIGIMKKIERSTLAGEDRTLLLDENSHGSGIIGTPIALTIDHGDNILYWIDSLRSYIVSLDLKNENANPILLKQVVVSGSLFSLDLDPEFGFFATDRKDNRLHIVPQDFRKLTYHIKLEHDVPNGVIFYSDVNQPKQNAPCDNAGCNQLCVSDPSGHKCICTYGHQLQADNETCERDNSVIYDHEMIFSMEESGLCTFPPTVAHQLNPQYRCLSSDEPEELDVDVYALYVFGIVRVGDVTYVRRVRLETAESWDTIIQLPSSDVRGVAVDWVASNLYFTDAERHEIVISSLDGSYVTTLVDSDISRPTAVVVHSPKQYLFWSDTGANPRIERSDLFGRERGVLVNTDIESPTHLVIDMRNDRIYWADGETLFIESMEFDGQGREVFYTYSGLVDDPFFHFTGLAIFRDLLYAAEVGNVLRVFEIPNKSLIESLNFPGEIKTMKFFHESLQPISQGPCDVSNGGCDEICINTKYGAECVCSQPSCAPAPGCPLDIPNGQISDSCNNKMGESCNYTCKDGYRPVTMDSITCGDEGEWSTPSQELCIELHCVSEPCLNEGNCTDTDGGFNCTCPSQWQGDVCDTFIPNKERYTGGGSTGAVIGTSLVMVVVVIVAVVLLVLFRGKIFSACRDSDAHFDDAFPGSKSTDENAYSGVPSAPPATVPAAPTHQAHLSPVELKVQHIEGPQHVQWHSGVVQMAASADSVGYMTAPPDPHTYDFLSTTAKDGDSDTPAEMFPDGIENGGMDETDSNGIDDYSSMKAQEVYQDYIMPDSQPKVDASGEGRLQSASAETVSPSVNDSNSYAKMQLSSPDYDNITPRLMETSDIETSLKPFQEGQDNSKIAVASFDNKAFSTADDVLQPSVENDCIDINADAVGMTSK